MKLIVAFCKNRGIGFNNNIPWRLTADIRRFRKVTVGNGSNAVIMGRNTWDSLPENYRPLPKRANIVLTSKVDIYSRRFGDTGTTFVSSIGEAQDFCEKEGFEDTWVIGGEKIYKSFLKKNLITDIYTTQLKKSLRCDAFFSGDSRSFSFTRQFPSPFIMFPKVYNLFIIRYDNICFPYNITLSL